LPKYFWEIPASSTGKFHPSYALSEGGLIRHTKAAVKIALELFRNESVQHYTEEQKDIIISSLILHDGCKSGLDYSKYTVTEHPLIISNLIKQQKDICKILKPEVLNKILNCIETHMGQWTTDFKSKKEVLKKPEKGMQIFVHMCDYLASRKCIEINFEV
jgi:hypothetical protein